MIHYEDDLLTLHQGDALDIARTLPDRSVGCIVTSPPYYGLRDYGTAGQYGAEDTVEAYVDRLVQLFRELRRVLVDDGTLWLNLGDSYAANWSSSRAKGGAGMRDPEDRTRITRTPGIAPKNLIGIPWRVALALQDDGWILRSDIVWAKPNPTPESVRDRPTRAHEFVFLLTKSPRYYYDAEAISEPVTDISARRVSQDLDRQAGSERGAGGTKRMKALAPKFGGSKYEGMSTTLSGNEYVPTGRANKRDVWTVGGTPFSEAHFAVFPPEIPRTCIRAGSRPAGRRCDCDEIIATPLGGEVDDPSIEVGRAGLARPRDESAGTRQITRRQQRADARVLTAHPELREELDVTAEAWAHYTRLDRAGARPLPPDRRAALGSLLPDVVGPCEHPVEAADVVLDPFSGSGTTGMVALLEGRRYVGIDLNPEYLDLSLRTRFAQPPLAGEALA